MYKTIYVPVDNSDYSNRAYRLALDMGSRLDETQVVGSHVYAARMHDYRFKQMEYTLPEEYLQEKELERQRKIHDSLITMGLELISDSYLDQMEAACKEKQIPFERKMMDGKHYEELIKDIEASGYDLTVLGAHGIGKVRDSQLGSVCVQVTRSVNKDFWIVKETDEKTADAKDTIMVCIDGSPQSFGALRTAMRLSVLFDKKIELISVYDPYLHYAVFNGIVDVLSNKAKKVFRFEEQNQLHEEIIDTGLAQIYQSHLNVAETMANEAGFEVGKTLLDGKAFQKILDHVRKVDPWLLVMGRLGVHSEAGTFGLGNTTENLLRMAPCDLYLCAHSEIPKLDMKAEEAVVWTDEAKERLNRAPSLVRGIARTGILRLAIEQGHSVITSDLIGEAMDRFMPKYTARVTEELAESLAFERAKRQKVSMCRHCGVTAREEEPVRCAVCGAQEFEVISEEMIDKIVAGEGGTEEETTYDGRKLKWTKDARLELRAIDDAYQRRRAKARVEKTARVRGAETITMELVRTIIDDELGNLPIQKKAEPTVVAPQPDENQLPVVAEDAEGVALRSAFKWEQDAITRMLRVPAGFMRDRTQNRVEELTHKAAADTVTLALVEQGIKIGQEMMEALLKQAEGDSVTTSAQAHDVTPPIGVCPFSQQKMQEKGKEPGALNEVTSVPFAANRGKKATSGVS